MSNSPILIINGYGFSPPYSYWRGLSSDYGVSLTLEKKGNSDHYLSFLGLGIQEQV